MCDKKYTWTFFIDVIKLYITTICNIWKSFFLSKTLYNNEIKIFRSKYYPMDQGVYYTYNIHEKEPCNCVLRLHQADFIPNPFSLLSSIQCGPIYLHKSTMTPWIRVKALTDVTGANLCDWLSVYVNLKVYLFYWW